MRHSLFSEFRGILGVGTFHNRIHRAALLTKSTIDALCHINIVPRCAAGPVLALLGFDGDGLRGADGLAQLASDAAFFTGGVAAEGVFASETGRDWAFFERIIYGVAG